MKFTAKSNNKEYFVYFRHNTTFATNYTTFASHYTICNIINANDGNHVTRGLALCSKKDQYIKSIGRKVAFTRAINKFDRREDRTEAWTQFLKTIKGSWTHK